MHSTEMNCQFSKKMFPPVYNAKIDIYCRMGDISGYTVLNLGFEVKDCIMFLSVSLNIV